MADPMQTAAAAPKLFREPAQAHAVQCPACGGPITLRGFGAVEQVSCPFCGTDLAPEESGALSVLRAAQRQRRPSALPLQVRGTFDGHEWEIIGIVWRECRVDGVRYPWQEFLLYNPYRGYRWLIYQHSDGHWQLGEALAGAPKLTTTGVSHRAVEYKHERFKHFQTVAAVVTYVEGEFPWQVHVGDQAIAHDYVLPPVGIAIEEATAPDGSAEVAFTRMRHIEGAEVWKAFKLKGSPPRATGVGPLRPNPHRAHSRFYWIAFAVGFIVWVALTILYMQGRARKVVYENADVRAAEPTEITIGTPGRATTLELEVRAPSLDNRWAGVDVMLINTTTEEATGFGALAEQWSGVEEGEAWREGDTNPSVVIGGIEGGTYLLQIGVEQGDAAGNPGPATAPVAVVLREDVTIDRYILLPLFLLLLFPMIHVARSVLFEGRRWNNSDYASKSE